MKQNKKLSVLFAANVNPSRSGGVGRSMESLSDGLKCLGHSTEVVYHAQFSRIPLGYIFFGIWLCFTRLLFVKAKPDWIIARSSDGFFCACAVRLFGLNTRVALHNHGWEEKVFEVERRIQRPEGAAKTTLLAHLIRFPLLRGTLQLSHACISGTLDECRWLVRQFPKHRAKMAYIPNGISVEISPVWNSAEQFPPRFLFIGGTTWKKNPDYAAKIFRHIAVVLPDAEFHLVGTSVIPQPLMQFAKQCTCIRGIDPQEMVQRYRYSPFVISTSRYEGGHAYVLLEAMVQGCIVCVVSLQSTSEFLHTGKNGVELHGQDAAVDAQIIVALYTEQSRLAELSRNAYATAGRNLIERQSRRLELVLCTR